MTRIFKYQLAKYKLQVTFFKKKKTPQYAGQRLTDENSNLQFSSLTHTLSLSLSLFVSLFFSYLELVAVNWFF